MSVWPPKFRTLPFPNDTGIPHPQLRPIIFPSITRCPMMPHLPSSLFCFMDSRPFSFHSPTSSGRICGGAVLLVPILFLVHCPDRSATFGGHTAHLLMFECTFLQWGYGAPQRAIDSGTAGADGPDSMRTIKKREVLGLPGILPRVAM